MVSAMVYKVFVLGAVTWLIAGCLLVGYLALRDLSRFYSAAGNRSEEAE